MRLVIPCAGKGTRLAPLTDDCPKGLVKLHDKPIMDYILEPLKDYVSEYIFVVSHDSIHHYKEYAKIRQLPHRFFIQNPLLGLGNAVLQMESAITKEPIMIVNDDNILSLDIEAMLKLPWSAIAVGRVENPCQYGIVKVQNRFIVDIVENPKTPKGNLAIAGLYYILTPRILMAALKAIENTCNWQNMGYGLTEALQLMVSMGHKIRPIEVDEWLDCGTLKGFKNAYGKTRM